jgi:guanylate kinase
MHKIFIISGPGGCGKDSIIKLLIQDKELNLVRGVSATSRKMREGDVNGITRYFYSKEEFEQAIKDDKIIEYEIMDSNKEYYGTPKEETEKILLEHNIIFDKMAYGAMVLKKYWGKRATTIFIDADNDELRTRLSQAARAGEKDNIERRMEQATSERQYKAKYDYSFENHDGKLEETVDKIRTIIYNQISH